MPGVLIPTALVAAIVFIVAIPYRLGTLEAAGFLPVALLRRYGWEADHFVVGVLLPAIVLIVVSWVALVVSRRRARVAALLIAFTVFFGTGFEISRASLAKHWAVQKGELLLYPWKTFHDELNAVPARKIVLSRELQWRYHMSATTRSALARLSLRRPDLDITLARDLPADAEVAIASRYVYRQWRRRLPALAATASFDPAGLLVLVRPKEATEKAAELIHEHRGKTVEERLAELRSDRDPKARERLLQEILDNNSSSLRPLWSDQISAVALSLDGWTHGTRPAAILVENVKEDPSVHRIKLAVNAKVADYPIRVFLDDGEEVQTVVFARSGRRDIELPPVPPLSTRLFIIWCDKAWSPEGKDARQLGVRIIAPD